MQETGEEDKWANQEWLCSVHDYQAIEELLEGLFQEGAKQAKFNRFQAILWKSKQSRMQKQSSKMRGL